MARVIVYYAHPGHRYSRLNRHLAEVAKGVDGVTVVDLYAEYPRFQINIDREQQRLLDHDVIVLQHPLFWYATPGLLKEWIDLVLEHGWAYGSEGDKLKGKIWQLAVTAGGPETAYDPEGYNMFPLRTFLTPQEQTAHLCQMRFPAPLALFGALQAEKEERVSPHVAAYRALLRGYVDDRIDLAAAETADILTAETIPLTEATQ